MRFLALSVFALAACSDDTTKPVADTAQDSSDPIDSETVDETAIDTATAPDAPDTVEDPTFPLTCAGPGDCDTPCARGTCTNNVCTFEGPHPTATGCVVPLDPPNRGECVTRGAARPDAPTCFFCNPSVSAAGWQNLAWADGFENGGAQVAVEKLVQTPATWTITTTRAATGTHSLYFGDPVAATYDVGERAWAIARTTPLAVPPDTALTLSFQLWADTEETLGYDRLRVLVVAGDEQREVWSSDAIGGSSGGVFIPVTVPLGVVPTNARIAFEGDTLDGIINRYEGFYLDDVRVATTCCEPGSENAASDCDDNNPCTIDACDATEGGGVCVHQTTDNCCLGDVDCEDGDPCTADRCSAPGGSCTSSVIAECCDDAADCNDDDPCTADRCTGVACVHAPLCCERNSDCDDGDPCTSGRCDDGQCRYASACCHDDADCDDQEACTDDECDGGACTNTFTYAVGCCIPDVHTQRFDDGLPTGWSLTPLANNVGWQVLTTNMARSEPAVLYYGHKTLFFYETGGKNAGVAATPLMRMPDGVELELSFSILPDIEANATRDLFEVKAVVGADVVSLVTKADLVVNQWQDVRVDLSFAAGKNVQLRFEFDTVDGVTNNRRGIYLDDVRVLSTCLPL